MISRATIVFVCRVGLVLACIGTTTVGTAADTAGADDPAQLCATDPDRSKLGYVIAEMLLVSSLLLEIRSGNYAEAQETAGAALLSSVQVLGEVIEDNPCQVSAETLARLQASLRVVAAIDSRASIPQIAANPDAVRVLADAVDADPAHFANLVRRSNDWDHGIK